MTSDSNNLYDEVKLYTMTVPAGVLIQIFVVNKVLFEMQ